MSHPNIKMLLEDNVFIQPFCLLIENTRIGYKFTRIFFLWMMSYSRSLWKSSYFKFWFVASYLMITESFLVLTLNKCVISSFSVNSTILPTFHYLSTFNLDNPRTTEWFKSKFLQFDLEFINGILQLMFTSFRCRKLNFECHNEVLWHEYH